MDILEEIILGYAGLENTLSSLYVNSPYQTGINCEKSCKPPINIDKFIELLSNTKEFWLNIRPGTFYTDKAYDNMIKMISDFYSKNNLATLNDLYIFLKNYDNSPDIGDSHEQSRQRNLKSLASKIIQIIRAISESNTANENSKYDNCIPMVSRHSNTTNFLSRDCAKIFSPGSVVINRLNNKKYIFVAELNCIQRFTCGKIYIYKSDHSINNKFFYYILSSHGSTSFLVNHTNTLLISDAYKFVYDNLRDYFSENAYTIICGHSAGAVQSYYFAEVLRLNRAEINDVLNKTITTFNILTDNSPNQTKVYVDEIIGTMSLSDGGRSYTGYSSYLNSLKWEIDFLKSISEKYNDPNIRKIRDLAKNNLILFTTGCYAIFPSNNEDEYPSIKYLNEHYNYRLLHIGNMSDPYLYYRTDVGLLDPNTINLFDTPTKLEFSITPAGYRTAINKGKVISTSNLSDAKHHLSVYIKLLVKLYDNKLILEEIMKHYGLGKMNMLGGNKYNDEYYDKYFKYKKKYIQMKSNLLNKH